MGLAHRIIPTLLCKGRTLVKGKNFEPWRSVGLVVQGVRINAQRGVDELVLLDVSATREGRGPDFDLVRELSDILYAPLAVGGGVRSVEDVKKLLRSGADKVVIGTGAAEVADLVRDCADVVGAQAIVVSVDVGYGNSVMIHCGRTGYSHSPVTYAKWCERSGAGEILLQSIERDGTGQGYDLDLIRKVSEAVSIPVIAHGGCSGYEDMAAALAAGASAVAAGALFQFTDATPKGAAQFLAKAGVEVRL
jgi:cyclase